MEGPIKRGQKRIPPVVIGGYEIQRPSMNCYKLLDMKRQREVKWLDNADADTMNLAGIRRAYRAEGYLIHAVGNLKTGDKRCQSCKRDNGPMSGCVVVDGIGTAGCGNCVFMARSASKHSYLCFYGQKWKSSSDEELRRIYGDRMFQLGQLANQTTQDDKKEEEALTSPRFLQAYPTFLPPESDSTYHSESPAAETHQPPPDAQSPKLLSHPAAISKTPTPVPYSPPPTPPISDAKEEISDEFGDGESPGYTDVWMCHREGIEINCVCCYPGVWEI